VCPRTDGGPLIICEELTTSFLNETHRGPEDNNFLTIRIGINCNESVTSFLHRQTFATGPKPTDVD